jgi:uncharacterized RDD family membrane protein YckC
MYCTRCGTPLANGAAFCGVCGHPTSADSAAAAGRHFDYPLAPRPTFPYAGFWLRYVAYLIDLLVALGIVAGMAGITALLGGRGVFRRMAAEMRADNPAFEGTFFAVLGVALVVLFLGNWFYFAWMESSEYQGTLGKMAMGLAVTDLDGQRVTFGRASGRYFAKILTQLIPLQIGYVMAGLTEKKQALHDIIASCLVLRKT